MLTLQNVFASLLLAFVAILLLASMAVLSHSIGSTIEQDYTNMGVLKTYGGHQWEAARNTAFAVPYYSLMRYGGGDAALASRQLGFTSRMTVTTTGLLIPSYTAHRGLA